METLELRFFEFRWYRGQYVVRPKLVFYWLRAFLLVKKIAQYRKKPLFYRNLEKEEKS